MEVSCKISVKTAVRNVYGPFYEQFSFVRQNRAVLMDLEKTHNINSGLTFRFWIWFLNIQSTRILMDNFINSQFMKGFDDIDKDSIQS